MSNHSTNLKDDVTLNISGTVGEDPYDGPLLDKSNQLVEAEEIEQSIENSVSYDLINNDHVDRPNWSKTPYAGALKDTLERAEASARISPDGLVTPEHVLLSLLDDPDALDIICRCQVGSSQLTYILSGCCSLLESPSPRPAVEIKYSKELIKLLSLAASAAIQANQKKIDGAIVLAALVGDTSRQVAELLVKHGLTFEAVMEALGQRMQTLQSKKRSDIPADTTKDIQNSEETEDVEFQLSDDPDTAIIELASEN
ncbi:MAG: Clp protease N-terminal domain-containing protein, partial [Desulfobulbia bacterium]